MVVFALIAIGSLFIFGAGAVVGMIYERSVLRPCLIEAYRRGRVEAELERVAPTESGIVRRSSARGEVSAC